MKLIILMLASLVLAITSPLIMAEMDNQTNTNQTNTNQTNTNQTMTNTQQTMSSNVQADADVLAWLVALNKIEIAAGKEVSSRKKLNPLVKGFADFMVKQHTQLLKDTMRVSQKTHIEPVTGDSATALQKEGDDLMSQLKPLNAQDIQKPYIDAMVKGHTEALSALKDYISNTKNSSVKDLLKITAGHVEMHLKKAKVIQSKIGG